MSYPPLPGQADGSSDKGSADFMKFMHIWDGIKNPGSFIGLSMKKKFNGRILPSFDFSLNPKDAAFKTSTSPYRVGGGDDSDAPFGHWYFPFYLHAWYGPNKRTIISPKSLRRLGMSPSRAESVDPIDQINYFVHQEGNKWHQEWDARRYGTFQDPSPIPIPASASLFNVFGKHGDEDADIKNHLMYVKTTGMDHMLDNLNAYRKPSADPRDPNFSEYLYGDVTDKNTGLRVKTGQFLMDNGKSANTLQFSSSEKSLEGARAIPVTDEHLAGRINFFDIENSIHISTPAEIVDILLEDGVIPRDLIAEALEGLVDVPAAPKNKPVSSESGAQQAAAPSFTEQVQAEAKDDDDDIPFQHPNDLKVAPETSEPAKSSKEVDAAMGKHDSVLSALKDTPLAETFDLSD